MKKRQNIILAVLAAVFVLVFVAVCGGLLLMEPTVLPEEPEAAAVPSKTVTKNGIDYYPRQDITVILLIGIDEPGPVRSSMSYNNKGEADMVVLAVIGESQEVCHILALNRDTMMQIPVLGLGGKQAGTKVAQLALAHTYGSGLEDSCENTRKAVSDFLGGITIDYYISMNLDAVAILNDAVGGVTVTVTDDFSAVDETIRQGQMVLRGQQALSFVQTRWNVGDHLNLSRMERQKEYMENFLEALRSRTDTTENFVLDTYETVAPYLVSDIPLTTLSGMVERYKDHTVTEFYSPEGENVLGEEYYEFYADPDKLEDLILELFYAPQK